MKSKLMHILLVSLQYLNVIYSSIAPSRNLNSGTSSSNTENEDNGMSFIHKIFYMMANMGGLYTFLIFVGGSLFRWIFDTIYIHNVLSRNNKYNREIISKFIFLTYKDVFEEYERKMK